jgi:hypothetical protein
MNAIELIAQDLFDKVRSRFSNLQMGDENGGVTVDPTEARFFDFDFVVEGNNLGRVSMSINNLGTLKLFYSQGILEGHDPITTEYWYDFLKEMRQFAMRRILRFDARDISKGNLEKSDFQYLAQNGSKEDNMTEAQMYGSSKSSYRPLEKTLLIIRHNQKVGEDRGARSRGNNIKAIFIQNEAGERFKYPMAHLAGARAMQRHVANGGAPYDVTGSEIIKMSEQIKALSTFKRQVGNTEQLATEARGIVDRVGSKLTTLRSTLESISKQTHYESWRESVEAADLIEQTEIDPATLEDYKSKFTVSSFKEDLAQYFPLVYSIMQEAGELDLEDYVGEDSKEDEHDCGCDDDPCTCDDVKEDVFGKFEAWADEVALEHVQEEPSLEESWASMTPDVAGQMIDAISDYYPRRLEKHGDPTYAKNLYMDLAKIARANKQTNEFDKMCRAAQHSAHMDYDTNPGGFENWFWYLIPMVNRIAKAHGRHDVKQAHDETDKGQVEMENLKDKSDKTWLKSAGKKPGIGHKMKDALKGVKAFATGDKEAEKKLDTYEDMKQPRLPKEAMTEIARIVMTSINRGDDPDMVGTVPRGDESIKIEVTKKYGEKAGELAEQLLQIKKEEVKREFESRQQMAEMRRLAGLPITEADAWKKETPWMKATKKDPRGKVTNLSDKARRETEKHTAKDTKESTGDYSAKKAAAGKDIGKPGKNFSKIEKSAGGGAKGKRIAGKVLATLRNK